MNHYVSLKNVCVRVRVVVKIGDEVAETFWFADNAHVISIEEDLDKFGEFVVAKMLYVEFADDCVLDTHT